MSRHFLPRTKKAIRLLADQCDVHASVQQKQVQRTVTNKVPSHRKFIRWLSSCLVRSSRVHIRGQKIASVKEAIQLMDRFVDNNVEYPLQWDDFISWENPNPSVEKVRDELADLEPYFFSRDQQMKRQGANKVINIRNKYAMQLGVPLRDTLG
jgi:hypothetical protein